MKRIAAILISITTIFLLSTTVYAETVTQDNISVTLSTDKEEYQQDEDIKLTLSVTNNNNVPVENLSLEAYIPMWRVSDETESSAKIIESIDPGETVDVTYLANLVEPIEETEEQDDKIPYASYALLILLCLIVLGLCVLLVITLIKNKKASKTLSLILCLAMIGGMFPINELNISAEKSDNTIERKNIEVIENILVDDETVAVQGDVGYDEFENVTIELNNFKADIFDIYLSTEEKVLFTVEVSSEEIIEENAISLYDEEDELIANMNDNGVDGDLVADDSIYSAETTLYSENIEVENFYSKTGNIKSDYFEICFYRDISKEEFAEFIALVGIVSDLEFDEAVAYIESSDAVVEYNVDEENEIIEYKNSLGMEAVWEDITSTEFKGTGEFAIGDDESFADMQAVYEAAEENISQLRFTSDMPKKDIIVLRPFRNSDFQYDDFKYSGELISDKLDSDVTIIDNENVTLDVMKSLESYGIVLLDSHGMKSGPSIVIGEKLDEYKFLYDMVYYAKHAEYSADYLSGRIKMTSRDNLAVTNKFFDKYYDYNSLNHTAFYLGCCYSMYNDNLANALLSKSSEAVVGFTDSVSVGYCNSILFEAMTNCLLLSFSDLDFAVNDSKRIYGDCDPGNTKCFTSYKGDEIYSYELEKYVASGIISGKVCKASDRAIPIPNASIEITKGDEIIKQLQSDENGNYSTTLPIGDYSIKIFADNYIDFECYATVKEDETLYMETFLMIEGEEGTIGTATGQVKNALDGQGVPNATLEIKQNWNSINFGDVLETIQTDENGNYTVDLPIGNYTVIASKENFITNSFNIIVQNDVTAEQNGTITPDGLGDNVRIVLTWGENPRDMDSHLEGTIADGSYYHVYYDCENAYENGNVVCNLDVDDTRSFGPETITLFTTTDKPYYYYVYKYAGDGTTASSESKVNVYQGETLMATFNVPTDLGDGNYWNVFAIKDGQIKVNNTITDSADISYCS